MREIKHGTANAKGSELEIWIPEMPVDNESEQYAMTLPVTVAMPLNKTPMTIRQKLARMCLRVIMPSLFSDFGGDTAVGLIAVHQSLIPADGDKFALRLERKNDALPVLEFLRSGRKAQRLNQQNRSNNSVL